jgi:hypothetical protein
MRKKKRCPSVQRQHSPGRGNKNTVATFTDKRITMTTPDSVRQESSNKWLRITEAPGSTNSQVLPFWTEIGTHHLAMFSSFHLLPVGNDVAGPDEANLPHRDRTLMTNLTGFEPAGRQTATSRIDAEVMSCW